MSETGLTELPTLGDRPASDGTVHLLYVGRLVRTKGLRDAIRALARLTTSTPVVLEVVGDGPDRAACEALVAELGLGRAVRFHGRQPRERVEGFYRSADIFVFPSYREPGGNVVFESMGYGVPLVVSDLGGPGSFVDETCAIRVHPNDPDQYADDLAAAITAPRRRSSAPCANGCRGTQASRRDRALGPQGRAARGALRRRRKMRAT